MSTTKTLINRDRLYGSLIAKLCDIAVMHTSRIDSSVLFITGNKHSYIVSINSSGIELIDKQSMAEVLYVTVLDTVIDVEAYATDKIYLKILEMEKTNE